MRQEIINTPQDSGLGDTLFVAFNKVNDMTLELYNQDTSFINELQTIQSILLTLNNGSTLNHQHLISNIIGLQTALNSKVSTTTFNSQITVINSTIQQINITIQSILSVLNSINGDINNINITLQTKVDEAPIDGETYGRKDGDWITIPQPDLSQYVPYTGATANVDLGTYSLKARELIIENPPYIFFGSNNDSFYSNYSDGINQTGISQNINRIRTIADDNSSVSQLIQLPSQILLETNISDGDYIRTIELEEGAITLVSTDNVNLTTTVSQGDDNWSVNINTPDDSSTISLSRDSFSVDVSDPNLSNGLIFDTSRLAVTKYVQTDEGFRGSYVYYDTDYNITGNEPQGAVYWNADRQTLQLKMNGTNYDYGMGLFFYIKNQSGVQINKGDVVGFAGTLGMSGIILGAKYVNDGSQPSDRLMGVAKEDIPDGGEGKVVFFGEIRGINTNAFSAGTILYSSNVTAGALTDVIPNAGTNKGEIAAVTSQSSTVGTIFVRALINKSLDELNNVEISGVTSSQFLGYDNGIWKNLNLPFSISGTTGSIPVFTSGNTLGDSIIFQSGSNVGIGTTSPDSQIQVLSSSTLATHNVASIGTFRVNGAGDVYSNGQQEVNTNTFFGENSGRLTTGVRNSFFGNLAGRDSTTARDNVFIGYLAGRNNTSGAENTFIGVNAGRDNLTSRFGTFVGYSSGLVNSGSNNTGLGSNTIQNNTTGGNNTAVGTGALRENINGSANSAIGLDAGRRLANGDNLTLTTNSIFIGRDTRALGNSQTNQIVIGYQAIGLGSNTTIIGNSSTTRTHLEGNLSLGTTGSISSRLHVEGSTSITQDLSVNGSIIKQVKTITGTTYTLEEEDKGRILHFTSNTEVTITIPTGLTSTNRYEGKQLGDGQLVFGADIGVDLRVADDEVAKTAGKYSVFALDVIGTEEYMLYGKLELS